MPSANRRRDPLLCLALLTLCAGMAVRSAWLGEPASAFVLAISVPLAWALYTQERAEGHGEE